MDLSEILNRRTENSAPRQPPLRSATLAQPLFKSPALRTDSVPPLGHPPLARQHSLPNYAHDTSVAARSDHPQTSYAPQRTECFRLPSVSVSPGASPNLSSRLLPSTPAHHAGPSPDMPSAEFGRLDRPTSTPHSQHSRELSSHSMSSASLVPVDQAASSPHLHATAHPPVHFNRHLTPSAPSPSPYSNGHRGDPPLKTQSPSSDASPLSAARTRSGTEDPPPPRVSPKRHLPDTSMPSDTSHLPTGGRHSVAEEQSYQGEMEPSRPIPLYEARFSAEREHAIESGVAEEYYDGDGNSLPDVSDAGNSEAHASDAEQSGEERSGEESGDEQGEEQGEEQGDGEQSDAEETDEESDAEIAEESTAEESAAANEWSIAEGPPTEEQLALAQAIFEALAEPAPAAEPVEEPSGEEHAFATAVVEALIYDGCVVAEEVAAQNSAGTASRKRGASPSRASEPTVKRRKYDVPPPWAEKIEWGTIGDMQPWVPKRRRQDSPDVQHDEILRYTVPQLELRHRRAPAANEVRHRAAPAARPNGIHPVPIRPGERPWEATRPKGMEWSIDNAVPYSDITREVANFLFGNVVEAPPLDIGKLEVEARLGVLMDTDTGQRLFLPISSEAIINSTIPLSTRFESLMSRDQHKLLNEYLNTETGRTASDRSRIPINYRHVHEQDTFYELPPDFLSSLPQPLKDVAARSNRPPKVRVTTDQKTGKVLAKIVKFRIQDMEIYCPRDAFDVRISVSFELEYRGLVDDLTPLGPKASRGKNRLSYLHQSISIDLTQVTPGNPDEKQLHELELEMDVPSLVEQGQLCGQGKPNDYEPMVGVFLNYIRAINRAASGSAR